MASLGPVRTGDAATWVLLPPIGWLLMRSGPAGNDVLEDTDAQLLDRFPSVIQLHGLAVLMCTLLSRLIFFAPRFALRQV